MTINDINISDIIQARRMDPIFFRYGTSLFGEKYKLESIGSCIIDIQSGVGAGKGDQASETNGIVQIRPTNIDKDGLLVFDKNVYVPIEANMPSLKENDVLFNNTNSQELVGKTAIFRGNEPYRFSNHITRIRVNQNKILPEYLWIILNLYQRKSIFYSICTNWNNQSGIGNELLKSTKIPLPILEKQKEIVGLYTKAQEAKLTKEKEAKSLLDSIDSFVLKNMGVALPSKDIYVKVNVVSLSQLIGNRYDPYYHNEYFEEAFKHLKDTSNYKLVRLSDITVLITSGITPKSGGDDYTDSEHGVAFIRSGNIDIMGEVDFDNLLYIKRNVHNTRMKSSKVQNGDIMIAIVGATIGQVGIYHSSREANINQAIALVRLKDGYNPEYIKEVIKSSIGQLNLDRLKRPVARANINLEEISSMLIPVPEIEIQNEIVKSVVSIRQQAKRLQKEGVELLEIAKQEIEKIILG
ncbi:restriction endonuclease subunit S [Parabacteroides distasonis]|uniref:Type I restriction modification DNA specificity domain-containing protein n=1 Tax=Parabacteroides distasonis TaxID=823 RepID=A0A4V3RRK2_PARDI|nr:restriction endonuclease subunit S [Parabacteroides distasonis]TGY63670.1 hypothetical protein E5342_01450 [Parabacteroides distasonis]